MADTTAQAGTGPDGDKAKGDRHDGGSDKAKGPDAGSGGDAAKSTPASTASAQVAPAPVPVVSKRQMHLPSKIFFLLVSIGLFISTLTGLYMTYKYDRNRWLVTGVLVAGAVIPMVLLPL